MVTRVDVLAPALAGLFALGCPKTEVDKPEPPDVRELERAYHEPDGLLTDENAAEVVATLEERLVAGSAFCGWDPAIELLCAGEEDCPLRGCAGVTDVLGALYDILDLPAADGGPLDAGADAEPEAAGVPLRGEGFLRVERICPGAGPEPVPDEKANGLLSLTVGFTDRGLDPIVWGTAERCLVRVLEPLRIDAALTLVFGEGPWKPADGIAFLLRLAGEARLDAGRATLEVDFGMDLVTGELTIAVPTADGGFVFFVGIGRTGFRGADGEWACDFGARTCSNGADSVSF